jgi:hypothetical protein
LPNDFKELIEENQYGLGKINIWQKNLIHLKNTQDAFMNI